MKRDLRLHGLTSDHHHALVLVRRIHEASQTRRVDAAFVEAVHEKYQTELRPHFEVEEDLLLPALEKTGQSALVSRTLSEHEDLRRLLSEAKAGDFSALERFASLLEAHVRFEERELFGACEQFLDGSLLDDVAARAPKNRPDT